MSDIILFAHPTFGVFGMLAAVWLLVEALNASEANRNRIRYAAFAVTVCIVMAWLLGGYWYTVYYAPEKAIILKGPWPWAHNFVMETKEHLFFIPLILALYLPIVAAQNLAKNKAARIVAMAVAGFVVLNALAIEGAGAVINYGVKVAFVHTGIKGAE
jgi:asparagine N-glycosylation enzyme membrane subunit Stt3